MSHSPPDSPLAAIREAAQKQGLTPLARALGTNRMALGNYLAGTARAGTALLLETRFRALGASTEPPRA